MMLSTPSIKPQPPLPSSSRPPASSIKQALSDFESILDVGELQRFRSAATIPRATDVLDFVGQIDSNNRDRGGRCVAQRLCKFLESVQQFTGVVNTFVSADPMPAALIWGSVRLTLLTASNVASFFDKTTNMIMIIGRSCPIYEQFGSLYPGQIDLQRALCDYYATIIRICIRMIEVSRRTVLTQTISSVFLPFESQFKDLLDALEQDTKIVRLHLTLASNQAMQDMRQTQVDEVKQNQSRFRATQKYRDDVKREHESARQWRLQQGIKDANRMRISIKRSLCTFDYQKPWKQATRKLVPGTASWILHENAFTKWHSDQRSSMVWCTGKMGSGKTMIMSHIVSHLYGCRQADERIAFHFCRSDEETSLTARSIVGSLVSQMLSTYIENLRDDRLLSLYNASQAFELSDLVNLLVDQFERDATYYVILDGLDECEQNQINILCDCLSDLIKRSPVCLKFVCASRPELEKALSQLPIPQHKLSLAKGEVDKDIETAITALMTSKLDQGLLQLGDPLLVLQITNVLLERADGIFLWVVLVLEDICSKNSDVDILDALHNLPLGMSQLLKQKTAHMSRSEGVGSSVKLLEFCGVAKRPLTLEEYREVLSIAPGQTSLDSSRFVNDMIKLVADCKGLLFYDEEDLTVHYVHPCIKTFLFTDEASPLDHSDFNEADKFLGYLCMTYLNFSNFERQVVKSSKTTCTVSNPIDLGLTPVTRHNGMTQKIARKLLQHRKRIQQLPAIDINKTLTSILTEKELSQLEKVKFQQYSFLAYARLFWIYHVRTLGNTPAEYAPRVLFDQIVSSSTSMADLPWVAPDAELLPMTTDELAAMFVWALIHDHVPSFQFVSELAPTNFTQAYQIIVLCLTTREESDSIFTRLLATAAAAADWTTNAFTDVLVYAAGRGHDRQVQKLLDARVEIEKLSSEPKYLSRLDETDTFLDCLERRLDQQAQSTGYATYKLLARKFYRKNALQAAVSMNHKSTVDLLLHAGARVQPVSLIAAAKHTDITVLRKLIEKSRDVNEFAGDGMTALLTAARYGNVNAVTALLAAGARPDHCATYAVETPLRVACEGNYESIVDLLLDSGADPNFDGLIMPTTPLQIAVRKGARHTVQRLLAAGANPNQRVNVAGTCAAGAGPSLASMGDAPLMYAIIGDDIEIMRDLVRAGADIHATFDTGKTPVSTAIRCQKRQVALELVTAGAELTMLDDENIFKMFGLSMWSFLQGLDEEPYHGID